MNGMNICIKVQRSSFLKNRFFNWWRELCVLVEFFVYNLRVCGYIWMTFNILSVLHARHLEAQLTMHGPQFRLILGNNLFSLYNTRSYLSSLGVLSAYCWALPKAVSKDAQLLVLKMKITIDHVLFKLAVLHVYICV
jgi:hypothetical protein